MATTFYTKLVRDKIPEILDAKGVRYEKRVASLRKYKSELIKKLPEEALEFSEAGEPEELADVMEVVRALLKLPAYKNVEQIRKRERKKRGGYDGRIIVEGEKDTR